MSEKKTKNNELPVGEILKKSWDLFQKNMNMFIMVALISLGLSLIPAIIMMLGLGSFSLFGIGSQLSNLGTGANATMPFFGLFAGMGIITILLVAISAIFVGALVLGATNYAVYNAIAGHKVKAWDNFKMALKKFWIFLGASIVVFLIVGIGFMLLFVPGIIAIIFLSFTYYLIVAEKLTVGKAISRSFELAKKNWILILVMMLILMAIFGILGMIPIINFVVSALSSLFGTIVIATIYEDVK